VDGSLHKAMPDIVGTSFYKIASNVTVALKICTNMSSTYLPIAFNISVIT